MAVWVIAAAPLPTVWLCTPMGSLFNPTVMRSVSLRPLASARPSSRSISCVAQFVAQAIGNRFDIDRTEILFHTAAPRAGHRIKRMKAAAGKSQSGKPRTARCAASLMRRCSRCGPAPRSPCAASCRPGRVHAFERQSGLFHRFLSGPVAISIVPRSLPLTCTAMVTVSETSSAGSASGQGVEATSVLWPSACPAALRQMRHHRTDQQHQRLQRLAAHGA